MSQKTNRRKMIIAINQCKVKQSIFNGNLFNIIADNKSTPNKHSQILPINISPKRYQQIVHQVYNKDMQIIHYEISESLCVETHIVYRRTKYNKILPISIPVIKKKV